VTNKEEILEFCDELIQKRIERGFEEEKEPEGIFTGRYIVDPVGNGDLPIWVASFALADYGTGIVKSSCHDERDFAFAKKYGLRLKPVLFPEDPEQRKRVENLEECYTDMQNGVLNEPEAFKGKRAGEYRQQIADYAVEQGFAVKKTNYKLRDWLVSRQRYWGAPIPIIYCEECGEVPVPEKDLPVLLPDDVDFMPTGESPLTSSKSFHAVKCPECDKPAKRESDTMDTFVCSSWYMFRFADPKNSNEFASKRALHDWCPVDLYVGGAEHTVLHLLYSRFFTKALHRYGYLDFDEPFLKLRHQGIILGEDNEKMSKSRGNVVNPDDVIRQYGADTLRVYEMFMGPFHDMKPWSTKNIEGSFRFLQKVWRLVEEGEIIDEKPVGVADGRMDVAPVGDAHVRPLQVLLHKTIKKVTEDIESFCFNTAISQMMILANEIMKEKKRSKEVLEKLVLTLSPFAPHLSEELWSMLGHTKSLAYEPWPEYDEKLVVDDTFELVFAVNGKKRSSKEVSKDISEDDAIAAAMEDEAIQRNIEGKEVIKKIYVKGKLVNVVVK